MGLVLPPVRAGWSREWRRCKRCAKVVFRDQNPAEADAPWTLPCGHDTHESVTEGVAVGELRGIYGHVLREVPG